MAGSSGDIPAKKPETVKKTDSNAGSNFISAIQLPDNLPEKSVIQGSSGKKNASKPG